MYLEWTADPYPLIVIAVKNGAVTPERDEDTGKFTREFPIEKFMEAIKVNERATTSMVAVEVGCSYDLAYRRLMELEAESKVDSMKVGDTYLWTIAR